MRRAQTPKRRRTKSNRLDCKARIGENKLPYSHRRDYATINELICLSNMENINAVLINDGVLQSDRLIKLNQIAIQQMRVLQENTNRKYLN